MLPLISVIMPVYNRADTIERAIASVLDQEYPHVELIILDAGSTDGTVEIIQRYSDKIAYWHTRPDKGAPDATNQGLLKASGELVVLLMADDRFESGLFKAVAEQALRQPSVAIFSFGARIAKMEDGCITTLTSLNDRDLMKLTFWNVALKANPSICSRFIRLSLYCRIGLFNGLDDEGKQLLSNDQDFMLRAILANSEDYYLDRLGYTYFSHDGSYSFNQSQQFFERHCREHIALADRFLHYYALTAQQKLIMHVWSIRESIKLALYYAAKKQPRKAGAVLQASLKKYHLIWLAAFCTLTPLLVFRRFFAVFSQNSLVKFLRNERI